MEEKQYKEKESVKNVWHSRQLERERKN